MGKKVKEELGFFETITAINKIKQYFERQLEERLELTKVQCPIFIKTSTGLQDQLSGVEEAVNFMKGEEKFEIVHSLAKWKRESLGRYEFPLYKGLYTDMKAIRKEEIVTNIHSLFVEQWDWEKIIKKSDRNIEYLKEIVIELYESIKATARYIKKDYPFIDIQLAEEVTFLTSQELEDMYPESTPEEREQLIGKEKRTVFIIGIGDKLKSGVIHSMRSPDYDDWDLNGDLLIYHEIIDRTIEITSMGIRVDKDSLLSQLEKADCLKRLELPYHQKIIKEEIPYTIGGGLGQSRIFMLLLEKEHIVEVQASAWEEETYKELKHMNVL